MRTVAPLLVILMLSIGFCIYTFAGMSGPEDEFCGVVFGDAKDQTIEMQLYITLAQQHRIPVELGPTGFEDWDAWLRDNFKLVDDKGARVELTKRSNGTLLPKHQRGRAGDFFIRAVLTPGTTYTYELHASDGEALRAYRRIFEAPTGDVEFTRVPFEPVE